MRWKAVEAFNAAPGLSHAANKVGIALICAQDGATRSCFPSELWLATMTGLSARSVVTAKKELKDAGLIYTRYLGQPRAPKHCWYEFNYEALERLSREAASTYKQSVA